GAAGAPAREATATAAGPQEVLGPGTGTFAMRGRAASADRTRHPELEAALGRSRAQTPSRAPRRQRDPMPSPPTAERRRSLPCALGRTQLRPPARRGRSPPPRARDRFGV